MRAQNDELIRTRQRVEAERLRYQNLFQFAPDGYLLTTPEGRILEANRAASLLLNIAPRFLKGRPLAGSVHGDDLREFHSRMVALRREGGPAEDPQEWILRLRRRQADPFYASLTPSQPPPVRGEAPTLRWTIRDVTDRRRAEADRLAAVQAQAAYEKERRIAETLQRALLRAASADAFPPLEIEAFYEAASDEAQIGGDFYDAFSFASDMVALVVGDVSGKGLAAAEMTAQIKYALRAFLRESVSPGLALARLNDFVCEAQRRGDAGSDHQVALTLTAVHAPTGEAVTASAGAEPVLLVRTDGGIETLQAQGLLLGVQPGTTYGEHRARLGRDDTLLMLTDGITEARRQREFLDVEGLRPLIARARDCGTLRETGQALMSGARAWAGGVLQDDACLLLARWGG